MTRVKLSLKKARLSVLHGERAFQAAQRAARGVDVVLNVGRSPYTDPFLVTTLLSIQLPLFPRLRVDLTSQFSCDLVHQLLEGRLDLAIATEPPESPLTTVKIDEAPFYIAMSERDELAACPSVMRGAEVRGILPNRVKHVIAPEEAFPSVADGSSLAFFVKVGALRLARNGVTVCPLTEETLLLRTVMASRADNSSKVARRIGKSVHAKVIPLESRQTAFVTNPRVGTHQR
jgi:DNA-binding transcriptional LysR family regulator